MLSRTLDPAGLEQFRLLQPEAVRTVADRFAVTYADAYARFGARGREATREDLAFHLEFLRPVLEFGLLQPMVDYLRWLKSVLVARAVPDEHLALSLDWLSEFYVAKLSIEHGAIVAEALRAVRTQFEQEGGSPLETPALAHAAWPEAAGFEAALLAGNQMEALALLTRCLDRGQSLVDVELHVIQPTMYHIGEQWQANTVSVAQEHMASAIVQSVMTIGLMRSTPRATANRRILLACVAGNNHTIGLRMVADAFQLDGWEVQYAGANVPAAAIVRHVVDWKPHLVGLSVSFPQQFPEVKLVIGQLEARLGMARPAVIVGGLAINNFAPLADMLHADGGGADSAEAVTRATRMMRGVDAQ